VLNPQKMEVTMKKLHYKIAINAPKEKVWNTMLEPATYKVWTAEFTPGSYYEGSWEQGAKIKFLDPKKDGMTAVIAANRKYEFLSIKHLGIINNGVEDTESPQAKSMAPAFENYTFDQKDGLTEVKIDLDSDEEFQEIFEEIWPKALSKLKQLCEK
jgi:hypothetical protein